MGINVCVCLCVFVHKNGTIRDKFSDNIKKTTYKANLSALLMDRVELARLPLRMKCHDLFCDLSLNRELFRHRRFQLQVVARNREDLKIKETKSISKRSYIWWSNWFFWCHKLNKFSSKLMPHY